MRDDELGSVITALGQRNAYDDEHSPAPLVAPLVARLVAVISACAICSSSRRFASFRVICAQRLGRGGIGWARPDSRTAARKRRAPRHRQLSHRCHKTILDSPIRPLSAPPFP